MLFDGVEDSSRGVFAGDWIRVGEELRVQEVNIHYHSFLLRIVIH